MDSKATARARPSGEESAEPRIERLVADRIRKPASLRRIASGAPEVSFVALRLQGECAASHCSFVTAVLPGLQHAAHLGALA